MRRSRGKQGTKACREQRKVRNIGRQGTEESREQRQTEEDREHTGRGG